MLKLAVTTNRIGRLSFTTSGGNTFSITFPQPREDIQLAEAMSVMNSLIASGIFLTAHGTLTGVRDIKVIDTTTNDLYETPKGKGAGWR